MPDHPSWPAELVEKGARALAKARTGFGWGVINDQARSDFQREAQAVLSALSGDLVPREEVVRQLNDALGGDGSLDADDLEGMVVVVRAIETARKYEAERYDTARSQADALAEALEATWMAGSWELADAPCDQEDPCAPDDPDCEPCEQRAALKKMDAALASYRETASGETEG